MGKRQRTLTPKMQEYVEQLNNEKAAALLKQKINEEISAYGLLNLHYGHTRTTSTNRSSLDIDPTRITTTALARRVFGNDVVQPWLDSGRTARSIWELSTPRTQCTAVIKDKNACWICGTAFESTRGTDPFGPVCEHILPIAQAALFLGLYSYRNKEDITPGMLLEYAWAHSSCNSIKTNIPFIKTTEDASKIMTWVADKDAIMDVLSAISRVRQFSNEWVKTRTDILITNKINPIVAFLQREPGLGNLIELAGFASLHEASITRDITKIPPPTKRARTAGGKRTNRRKTRRQKARR